MASAIYHALGSQNGSIRLLQLNPGGWSDKISCDLIHTCLSDDLVFEALSYVWGDDADTVAIILCSRGASVRANLASALRHLRLSDSVRNLWVDALCINQMDVAERSQQVTLMGEIYTKAEKVIVWLGQAQAGDSSTIDIMIQLAANDKMHWIKSKPSEDVVGFKTNDYLLDLLIFLKNPWWGRIWTIQEYILAQKTEFLCGPHCFPGSTLPALAKSYFKHFKRCCNFPADIKNLEISGIFNQMTVKDEFIKEEVEKTTNRFMRETKKDGEVRCAMDDILRREMLLSKKEGRAPMFHSRAMYDKRTLQYIGWALSARGSIPE